LYTAAGANPSGVPTQLPHERSLHECNGECSTSKKTKEKPTPTGHSTQRQGRKERIHPRSKMNNDKGKKGLMNQVCDAGVVTDLQDNEVQEETMEIIDKLLFKL
jgi:hypothetical protein